MTGIASNAWERTVRLRSGTLQVAVERAELRLDELCGFASRRSRKRGFVFVSKVLGKHYPVRPRVMNNVHERLAHGLHGVQGPAVLIALAETATGLGHGIYDQWLEQTGRDDVLFIHSTRYRLNRPLALGFEESHSHATAHLVYEPADLDHARLFRNARSLVLVDDELSTGRTLVNLAAAYRRINPGPRSVHLVCLTDWMSERRRAEIAAEIGLPTFVHSLLEGSFHFEPDPAFDPGPIPDVTGGGDLKDAYLPADYGRLGLTGPLGDDFDELAARCDVRPGQRVLVLGTGEFAHAPFRLARRLEESGCDVYYQSTTRSPLLVGGALASAREFVDNYHDGIPNYVYNVAGRDYDRVLIGYETHPLPAAHTLPEEIGATPVLFRSAVGLRTPSARP